MAKSRWFRYGLLTLLAVMAVFCVAFAWIGNRLHSAQVRRAAETELKSVGGLIYYEHQYDDEGDYNPNLDSPGPAIFRHLFGDDLYFEVVGVAHDDYVGGFPSGKKVEQALTQLEKFPQLRFVWIEGKRISDDGALVLSRLAGLEDLRLSHTAITDAGLSHFSALPSLRVLDVSGCRIHDAGVAKLSNSLMLEELDLSDTPITDVSLTYLAKMKSLQCLGVSRTEVTRAGVNEFRLQVPRCEVLCEYPDGEDAKRPANRTITFGNASKVAAPPPAAPR
jgi:hypothetical protein